MFHNAITIFLNNLYFQLKYVALVFGWGKLIQCRLRDVMQEKNKQVVWCYLQQVSWLT